MPFEAASPSSLYDGVRRLLALASIAAGARWCRDEAETTEDLQVRALAILDQAAAYSPEIRIGISIFFAQNYDAISAISPSATATYR
jgi:hypothetical protein